MVDGFRHARQDVKAYFLSHAHSGRPLALATISTARINADNTTCNHSQHCAADHYTGLTENWDAGLIICSAVTGRLVQYMLGIKAQCIQALPMDQPQMLHGEVLFHAPAALQALAAVLHAALQAPWTAWCLDRAHELSGTPVLT